MKLYSAVLLSFVFLASCSRYVRWAQRTFKQADKYSNTLETARSFIRSSYVYDQFNTVALFDLLWLAEPVRLSYAYLYAHHWNVTEETFKEFKEQQDKEAKNYLTFYLLMAPDQDINTLSLTNSYSRWAITLIIDGKEYKPQEIRREDDLTPEYKAILSKLLSRHKQIYLVRFEAYDNNHNPLITSATKTLELKIHSPLYTTSVCWDIA